MLKLIDNKTIGLNATMFIYTADNAVTCEGFRGWAGYNITAARNMAMANGYERTGIDCEYDKLVHVGWQSEDLKSTDMCRHDFVFIDDDGREWHGKLPSEYVPIKLLKGHKEGDTIEFTYPVTLSIIRQNGIASESQRLTGFNPDPEVVYYECELRMHVTLNQNDSPYNRRGGFDEVLATKI